MNIDDIIESAQLKGRVIALNAQVETLTAEVRCLEAVIRSHERVDCLTVANLKAEVEALMTTPCSRLLRAERKEVARLKAEVERLIKELENTDCMFAMASAFARDWNAAKEGKPSV